MKLPRVTASDIWLGLAYFGLASVTIAMTRYDGGVAFLWVAAAALIAALMARPRRHWAGAFLTCGIASFLATGLFGLGWAMAPLFVAVNLAETYVAARLFRQFGHSRSPLGSLRWLGQFGLSAGVAGPAAGAFLAAAVLVLFRGLPAADTFVHFFAGHALGNLTFIPMFSLVAGGQWKRNLRPASRQGRLELAGLVLLCLATTLVVFGYQRLPLLFLPMLPLILMTFRLGEVGAAIGVVIVAVVGGAAMIAGSGPIEFAGPIGDRLQFFQFYLAAAVLTVLPVAADLRNRARLHRNLRLSESRYRLLADHSSDLLLHLEVDGRVRFVSPSIRNLAGYEPQQLIGGPKSRLIAPEHRQRMREAHAATLAAAGRTCRYEYLAVTATGERRWFETHTRAVVDGNGGVDGVMSIVRDISERKAKEMQLAEAAMTDALTGLPNRRAFHSAVECRSGGRGVGDCVALIDLDHFKRVNDAHGHDAGDAVLRNFARIASRLMRKDDLVARIGGEEFAILLPRTTIDDARSVCERLREEMAASPTLFGGEEIRVTISGGVARLGEGGVEFALRVADAALYRAKRAGRDQLATAA